VGVLNCYPPLIFLFWFYIFSEGLKISLFHFYGKSIKMN